MCKLRKCSDFITGADKILYAMHTLTTTRTWISDDAGGGAAAAASFLDRRRQVRERQSGFLLERAVLLGELLDHLLQSQALLVLVLQDALPALARRLTELQVVVTRL